MDFASLVFARPSMLRFSKHNAGYCISLWVNWAEVGAKVCHAFIDLRYFHACSIAGSTAFYFAGQLALGSAKLPGVLPNESRVLDLDAIRQCEVGSQTQITAHHLIRSDREFRFRQIKLSG